MNPSKRAFCTWTGAALLALSTTFGSLATAQAAYPEKPVTLVVPFAPGGSSDSATRILAELLGTKWKQSVIVQNKPGALGSIGAMSVAKAPADGYTLLVAPVSIGTIELFLKNPGFNRDTDLAPITQFAKGDYVLSVGKDIPVSTMAELVEYSRQRPEQVFHGAFGGASRLAFESFALQNDIQPTNTNYRGEALTLTALAGGEIQVALTTLVGARPFIESGRIKALGIPAKERSPLAPNIPTSDESGAKNFYADFWFGLMAPGQTPDPLRAQIAADVAEVLARPEVQTRFQELGLLARSSTPAEFAALIKHESERWVEVAKKIGLEPQ